MKKIEGQQEIVDKKEEKIEVKKENKEDKKKEEMSLWEYIGEQWNSKEKTTTIQESYEKTKQVEEKLKQMGENAHKVAMPDVENRIYEEIKGII